MTQSNRQLIISAVLTFLILAIGMMAFINMRAKKESSVGGSSKKVDLRTVQLSTAEVVATDKLIGIDGRLSAYEKVDLFSEVNGKLLSTSKPFKEGTYFTKGDLLFEIDSEDAFLTLLSQRAALQNAITQIMPDLKFDYPEAFERWKAYLDGFDVNAIVQPFPESKTQQEKYFIGGKNLLSQYYQIKSLENKQTDYKIYAPFNGVVTAANTFTGALVRPGSNLGTLMSTARYELIAPIQLSDLESIKIGQKVSLSSNELDQTWQGRITRIGRVIDDRTQNLPVYITVSGKGLRDGMYLNGKILGITINEAMIIDEAIVVDQDYVLTVQDSIIKKQPIDVISRSNDRVILSPLAGEVQMITSDIDGLYEGQKVIATYNSTKTSSK